ncbi:Heat shock factor protein [Hypsizygus marmoreus]|uniref:Heat shock factor protein n=1 Tax=Hypsizygus marmoreus TaxID=39966 RepID=A0A369JTL2_HYPMA|nr:Heat shock factor protein [Hypsizygus marmoreus]
MATGQIALTRHRTPVPVPKLARQAVPAFLQKLHEMVNDPNNADLIRWSEAGDSFYVLDHERFAREVLGRWFKHQNFASFVRQLNMYGFHKIPHLQQGVLRSDSETDFWNFAHPNFHRGQPDLLCLIQRKKQAAQPGDDVTMDMHEPHTSSASAAPPASSSASNLLSGQVADVHSIVNGIAAIKRHQATISAELNELKRSNALLWADAMQARTRHQKQQDTINRIVKFLAGVFGQHASPHKEDVVDSSPSRAVIPRRRSRFMIEDGRSGKVTVQDEQEMEDVYPTVETPQSVPSPAQSTTYFGAYHSPSDTSAERQAPSIQSEASTPTQTTPTQAAPSPTAFLPSDVIERSVTPTRPAEFDPRIQVVLNQLTPAQIQQLLSSLSHTMDTDPSTTTSSPQHLNVSQITQYTPPTDLFTQFMHPLSPQPLHTQPPAPVESLLSFDDHGHSEDEHHPVDGGTETDAELATRIAKSWKDTDDIERDVNQIDTTLHDFLSGLGLDARLLASTAGASSSNVPSAASASATSPTASTLHAVATDGEHHLPPHGGPSDGHTSPGDSLFDFDSFLDGFAEGGAPDGLMYPAGGEALADLEHRPSSLPAHLPQQPLHSMPQTLSAPLPQTQPSQPPPPPPPPLHSLSAQQKQQTLSPAAKRKSNASIDLDLMAPELVASIAQTQAQAQTAVDAAGTTPGKSTKRRRNK